MAAVVADGPPGPPPAQQMRRHLVLGWVCMLFPLLCGMLHMGPALAPLRIRSPPPQSVIDAKFRRPGEPVPAGELSHRAPPPFTISGRRVVKERKGVVVQRPEAKGFTKARENEFYHDSVPIQQSPAQQQAQYTYLANKGYNISEIFVCFPGELPWKRIGRAASVTGDFKEAILCQWPMLIERVYYLHKRARRSLTGTTPVMFGYTDTEGNIVEVDKPFTEGFSPPAVRIMLKACGFYSDLKPLFWNRGHMKRKMFKDYHGRGEKQLTRPHLMHRKRNQLLSAQQLYNPDKYRGKYVSFFGGRFKTGLVVGSGGFR